MTEAGGRGVLRTLRGRLVLGSLAGLAVASLLFLAAATSFIRAAASDSARHELDRQAVEIGSFVSNRLEQLAGRRQLRSGLPTSIANLERLVGPDAALYYSGLPSVLERALDPELVLPAEAADRIDYGILAERSVQRIDVVDPQSGESLEGTAVPIELGGQTFGAVVVARPPRSFSPELGGVVTQVLAATALGLLTALALILVLTSRILRPLRALRAATRSVAEGDMRLRLGPTGLDELDELSGAFNRMVERLAERERLNRDFLMKVTHDLRTPLTAIRGHATALSDGVVPEVDRPKSLAAIEGESSRLDTMVSDLLDLAKIDAHTFRVEPEEIDPAEILLQSFAAFEVAAAERAINYQSDVDDLAPIATDPNRMQQIVSNLIENALRWTPAGGTIRVRARAPDQGGLEVIVDDSGAGIRPDQIDDIFEAFVSRETPDGKQGSGLGLAISRQLALALGGDLGVASQLGHGSSFVLSLPARAPEPEGIPGARRPE